MIRFVWFDYSERLNYEIVTTSTIEICVILFLKERMSSISPDLICMKRFQNQIRFIQIVSYKTFRVRPSLNNIRFDKVLHYTKKFSLKNYFFMFLANFVLVVSHLKRETINVSTIALIHYFT